VLLGHLGQPVRARRTWSSDQRRAASGSSAAENSNAASSCRVAGASRQR
jgi:hypothetical protein